jgi:hypothetical protein
MDYDEPHDKTWPIQWTKPPFGALVAVVSLHQFSQIWLHVTEDSRII